MYKIPANTLFVGKRLVFVPECHSTNSLAHDLSLESSTVEGSVIITDNQTAGRGQRGNSWESHAGKNLTFSIILKPGFLEVKEHFYLNIFTSLAILDYLQDQEIDGVQIKWPNDILVNGRKICGILIENQIRGLQVSTSVVGIGINMNQKAFTSSAATSLALVSSRSFILSEELEKLLSFVEARYLQLKQGHHQQLKDDYLNHLFRIQENHQYSDGENEFEGMIVGIDDSGLLQLSINGTTRAFDIKQIKYLT